MMLREVRGYRTNLPRIHVLAVFIMLFFCVNIPTTVLGDDSYEENDERSEAKEIGYGDYTALYAEDHDWYKIYLDNGDDITVIITFDSDEADLDLYLSDEDENTLDSSEGYSDTEEVSEGDLDSGWYFIEVALYDGEVSYEMRVNNEYEEPDGTINVAQNVGDEDDDDLLNDGLFVAHIKGDETEGVKIYLYDDDEDLIDSGFTDDEGGWISKDLSNGDYHYTTEYEGEELEDEGNFNVAVGVREVQAFCLLYDMDDDDNYNDAIVFASDEEDDGVEGVEIFFYYASNGTFYAQGVTDDWGFYCQHDLPEDDYTFRMEYESEPFNNGWFHSFGPGGGTPQEDDDFEENDNKGTANEVDFDEYDDLFCQDEDWYKIHLDEDDEITVTIYFDSDEADLDIFLYDADDNELDSSETTDDPEEVYYTADSSGWYYIRIIPYSGHTNYDMEIRNDAPEPDLDEWFEDYSYTTEDTGSDGKPDTITFEYDPNTEAESMDIGVVLEAEIGSSSHIQSRSHTIYGTQVDTFTQDFTTDETGTYDFYLTLYDDKENEEDVFVYRDIDLYAEGDPGEPPEVLSLSPEDDERDVPVDTSIHIEFSKSMDMDSAVDALDTDFDISMIQWQDNSEYKDDARMIIYPSGDLEYDSWFNVDFSEPPTDRQGNELVGWNDFSFKTEKMFVNIFDPDEDEVVSGSYQISGNASPLVDKVEVRINDNWFEVDEFDNGYKGYMVRNSGNWKFRFNSTEQEDGEFIISARAATDSQTSPMKTRTFIIDNNVAPDITNFEVDDTFVNGGDTINITASIEDDNGIEDITSATLMLFDAIGTMVDSLSLPVKEEISTSYVLPELDPGDYTISLEIEDKAGETSERNKDLTVSRPSLEITSFEISDFKIEEGDSFSYTIMIANIEYLTDQDSPVIILEFRDPAGAVKDVVQLPLQKMITQEYEPKAGTGNYVLAVKMVDGAYTLEASYNVEVEKEESDDDPEIAGINAYYLIPAIIGVVLLIAIGVVVASRSRSSVPSQAKSFKSRPSGKSGKGPRTGPRPGGKRIPVCPDCKAKVRLIKEYKKWYCYKCEEYVKPIPGPMMAQPVKPLKPPFIRCPGCGGKSHYTKEYDDYYCWDCEDYASELKNQKTTE